MPYFPQAPTATLVTNELPGGAINGSNTAFTVANFIASGTLEVYLNGQKLTSGASNDYTEGSTGFTMTFAPATGDILTASYLVANNAAILPSDSILTGITPSGSINGSNTLFTLSTPYQPGALEVYKNGIRLKGGGEDYTETSPTSGTFTMVTAPATGTRILVDYVLSGSLATTGSNSFVTDETPAGLINGSNAVFTVLQNKYVGTSLEVYINGLKQDRTTHVTETSPTAGTFTLDTAPTTGDSIRVNYQYSASTSSNADTVDGQHAEDLMPIGAGMDYWGTSVPSSNWMFANGQAISRTTYATLFQRMGTTHGVGDGSTTFNLPDKRGRVTAGKDDMGGSSANRLTVLGGLDGDVMGSTGGTETVTLTTGNLPAHSHGVNHNIYNMTAGTAGSIGNLLMLNNTGFQNVSLSTSNTGSDTPHANVQPTIIANYIIKVL